MASSSSLYLEKVLVPTLAKGEVVILDNLGSHKGKSARDVIRIGGAHLLFLPPRIPITNTSAAKEFFQHRLVFDRSSLTRWRNRMGEERLAALIQESLSVATRTNAIKPSELSWVIVDTMVQPTSVTFPTDAKPSQLL